MQAGVKVRTEMGNTWVGEILPCRGQEAPQKCAIQSILKPAGACQPFSPPRPTHPIFAESEKAANTRSGVFAKLRSITNVPWLTDRASMFKIPSK